jgi:hypothetical protein
VFVLVDSVFEFAQCCGLTPPLDSQAAWLSFEGRAVPDYGAPFNFLAKSACPASPSLVEPASCRRFTNAKKMRREVGGTPALPKPVHCRAKTFHKMCVSTFVCFP